MLGLNTEELFSFPKLDLLVTLLSVKASPYRQKQNSRKLGE